ncbi:1-acylglycerol-3-phosphate O-acyltransferase Pnpla3 isoform X2 [Leptopilina heterotoma]|uniref:1-acylglycerol-3-phosphate O-acyltransferase Pnpla3 isoform X2 n=1 Tax=Leptopilina heterotoma TaxID=63436 RepID=UPI001CA9C332|nr:1-acylglycerol-3-phosphate O-acyltransferase Pnpla3 isoform X2 [Leptopilina heterotoma]
MNLSFAGCGFLGIYHVGVAVCFKNYAPHLLLDKISGASAGAMAACCLLCDLPLGEMTSNLLKMAEDTRQRTLGPFSPSFNVHAILMDNLQQNLPEDAHLRVNGKLHVSLTRVYDGKNVIVSQFNSKEDLLQALLASSFIPIFSGILPPRFHGIRYMDGGFSDNLPTLDENTITISPFCGESDICPRDISSQLFHVNVANTSIELSRQNIYRFARILFPPNPEILSNMCKQGFDDALRFLHRNNLINCNRCLAVQSTFVVSETLDDNMEYDPECLECKMHRQEALVANFPDTLMSIFQDAIDSANKGILNWLFNQKSVKLLSLLSIPYTLPADVVYATVTKFVMNTPKLSNNLLEISRFLMEQLTVLFPKINFYYQTSLGTIKCQLNVTEYSPKFYGFNVTDGNDGIFKKTQETLNLTLRYNKSWKDLTQSKSNSIINMPDFNDDTFENTLQATSDQDALMAYYYMDDDNKVRVAEIFDVTDSNKRSMTKMNVDTNLQFDDWDEPTWMRQHSLTDDLCEFPYEETKRRSSQDSTDISIEEDVVDGSNIFSDPESEWGIENGKNQEIFLASNPPVDSRPEVDQPSVPIS